MGVVTIGIIGFEPRHATSTTIDEDARLDEIQNGEKNDRTNDRSYDDCDWKSTLAVRSCSCEGVRRIVDSRSKRTKGVGVICGSAAWRILARDDGADSRNAVEIRRVFATQGNEGFRVRHTVGLDGCLDAISGGGDGSAIAVSANHHDVSFEGVVDDGSGCILRDGVDGGLRGEERGSGEAVLGVDHVCEIGDCRGGDVVDVLRRIWGRKRDGRSEMANASADDSAGD